MSDSPTGNGTSGVTRRCVSLAQGTLNPDARVNYEFGLVLGVDDFRQEQLYHLEKEYMHNRGLHGYGTVAGLDVTLEADGDDMRVNVSPGVGIDQAGRAFVVRFEQCANLRPWLRRQAQSDDPAIAQPATTPGRKPLYVVATYDECLDALVTIAGQPCATSEQAVAPSRIRDAFQIDLRWQPPAMPAWDAIRCFADLMALVRFAPDLTDETSDEAEITERVRLVGDCEAVAARQEAWLEAGNAPNLYLPEDGGRAALDRIFTVWVTEVRPDLLPDVLDPMQPGVETGVLLATIDLIIDEDTSADEPVFSIGEPVSDEGRPYLLQTQLIQELVTLGAGGESLPQREFATLLVQDSRNVLVWLHHPNPVLLPESLGETVQMFVNGDEYSGSINRVGSAFNTFQIRGNQPIEPAARVELRFTITDIRTGGRGEGEAVGDDLVLRDSIAAQGFDYVGRDGDVIVVYTIAPELPDVRPFVTINTVTSGTRPELSLWFHVGAPVNVPAEAVTLRRMNANPPTFAYNIVQSDGETFAENWVLRPTNARLTDDTQLLLSFNTDEIQVGGGDARAISLTQYIRRNQRAFLGYDGANTIIVPYVVDIPPVGDGPTEPGLTEEDVRRILMRIPTRPFVTITPVRWDREIRARFELWFHLDHAADIFESVIEEPNFRVYVEGFEQGQTALVRADITDMDRPAPNRIVADIITERAEFFTPPIWCRFVFPLGEGNQFRNAENEYSNIRDYMEQTGVKLDGHYMIEEETGQECLVVFVRLPHSLTGERGVD